MSNDSDEVEIPQIVLDLDADLEALRDKYAARGMSPSAWALGLFTEALCMADMTGGAEQFRLVVTALMDGATHECCGCGGLCDSNLACPMASHCPCGGLARRGYE